MPDTVATEGRQHVERVVYCECGCGGITNERQREAQRLRNAGWKVIDIEAEWGLARGSVKAILHRKPSRFLRGHAAAQLRGPGCYEQACERCGSVMFRSSPTKFCGKLSCTAQGNHTTAWLARSLVRETARRNKERAERILREHAERKQHLADAEARRERTLRELAHLFEDRREAREAAREATRLQREREREDGRIRREEQVRKRAFRKAVLPRYIERERQAFRVMEEGAAQEWLAGQASDVQEFVQKNADPALSWKSMDKAFSDSNSGTLYDLIPGGGTRMNPRDAEWFDPVGDLDFHQINLAQLSIPEMQVLIRDLPIIPGDWVRRLRDGEIKLVIEGDGTVAFVTQSFAPDAVPWRDATGPIPQVALSAPGGMAHHKHSRKQKQKLAHSASQPGHRPDRKSKAAR